MLVVPIRFAKRSRRNVVREASRDGVPPMRDSTRVRLRPRADWHKRNFLTSVLIPSLFVKRAGGRPAPQFPKIREGEICITWIGHASFLIQTHEVNILIDPIWSKWLKVIKRLKQPGFEIHHLPSIDFVLVTHAHFDHLDRRTLRRVATTQPILLPTGARNADAQCTAGHCLSASGGPTKPGSDCVQRHARTEPGKRDGCGQRASRLCYEEKNAERPTANSQRRCKESEDQER